MDSMEIKEVSLLFVSLHKALNGISLLLSG